VAPAGWSSVLDGWARCAVLPAVCDGVLVVVGEVA